MTFFVDSNILLYAVDRDADGKRAIAHDILVRGQTVGLLLSSQVLGEFLNVIRRKQLGAMQQAIQLVAHWSLLYPVTWTSPAHVANGARIADRHRLQYWDSMILAIADEQGAAILLTEDMQDGFTFGTVTIVNPFVPANRSRLNILLRK